MRRYNSVISINELENQAGTEKSDVFKAVMWPNQVVVSGPFLIREAVQVTVGVVDEHVRMQRF